MDHVRVIQEGKVHTQEADPSSIVDDGTRGAVRTLGQNGGGDLGPAVCLPNYQANYVRCGRYRTAGVRNLMRCLNQR